MKFRALTLCRSVAVIALSPAAHAQLSTPETKIVAGARHPRGQTDWPKVGIFAQRGKNGDGDGPLGIGT